MKPRMIIKLVSLLAGIFGAKQALSSNSNTNESNDSSTSSTKGTAIVNPLKSSWKTMEFWVSFVPLGVMLLVTTGVIGKDDADEATKHITKLMNGGGLAAAFALVTFFVHSRGKIKANAAANPVVMQAVIANQNAENMQELSQLVADAKPIVDMAMPLNPPNAVMTQSQAAELIDLLKAKAGSVAAILLALGLLCLAAPSQAFAQGNFSRPSATVVTDSTLPIAKIVAPAHAKPGRRVIFDASTSTGTGYGWKLENADKLEDFEFDPIEGGKKIQARFFTPAVYRISVAVTNGKHADLTTHEITISETVPPKPDGGGGNDGGKKPDPKPVVIPDTPMGLAKFTYENTKSLSASAKLRAPNLSASLKDLAKRIRDGAVSVGAIQSEITKAFEVGAGPEKEAWQLPAKALAAEVKAKVSVLKWKTDLPAALDEICQGLEFVK